MKGRLSPAMDRIEVPTHDWFNLERNSQLYQYNAGNSETRPAAGSRTYYPYHSLKVIPTDTTQILDIREDEY